MANLLDSVPVKVCLKSSRYYFDENMDKCMACPFLAHGAFPSLLIVCR